jgi:hypothetical protein
MTAMTIPNVVIRFRRDLTIALQLGMVAAANILGFCLRFDGVPPAWALTSNSSEGSPMKRSSSPPPSRLR